MSFVEQVKEFMVACGQSVGEYNKDQLLLYNSLVVEEHQEIIEEEYNTPNHLKEVCDLLWVTIGYGLSCGYDLEGAFNEVYRSNMSKLVDGKPLKREDGKVIKGPNYSPADVSKFV